MPRLRGSRRRRGRARSAAGQKPDPPQREVEDETRFQMLETIHEFGLERLQKAQEWEQVRQAHADYYLDWAETSRKGLFGSGQGFYSGAMCRNRGIGGR